eukprot:5240806-Ditylum_brightwellii.AAC.1
MMNNQWVFITTLDRLQEGDCQNSIGCFPMLMAQAVHHPGAHLFEEAMKEEMPVMEVFGVWEEIDETDVPYTSEVIHCLVIEITLAFK